MSAPESGSESFDFEAALEELEKLVGRLEEGDLPLEKALEQFERGVKLTRSCQEALKQAEQKVDVLMSQSLDSETEAFEPES